MKKIPYLLIAGVCVAALLLGTHWPMPGAPVFAMVLGVALAPWAERRKLVAGSAPLAKKALLGAVVLLGLGLDSAQTGAMTAADVRGMVATVVWGLLVTGGVAWSIGLRGPVALLVAVGTSICGGSAIAAVAGVSGAREDETAQALATIFLYNIVAALLFPGLGALLGMTPERFGWWAGTAINDTSSVLAASFAYGGDAGVVAMQVKMARTLMILPVSLGVALLWRWRGRTTGAWRKVLPWPAIGFGAALLVRALTPEAPEGLWHLAGVAGHGLMVLALACIGLSSPLGRLWREGRRALLAGGLGWVALALFSLGIQ